MIENKLIDKAEYEKQLAERWNWIAEDISDEETRLNTMLVLENSYKKMVSDGSIPQGWLQNVLLAEDNEEGTLTEAPQMSGAVGDYVIPKVMFPVIRRVMPELIANKLVSVQPLQQPTGVIYYITYRYSDSKSNVKAGDEFSGNPYQTDPAYSTYYTSEKLGPIEFEVTSNTTQSNINVDDKQIPVYIPTSVGESADKVLENAIKFLDEDANKNETYKRVEIFNNENKKAILIKYAAKEGDNKIVFKSDDGVTPLATLDLDTKKLTFTEQAAYIIGSDSKPADNEPAKKFTVFIVYNQEGTSRIPEMEFDIDHMDVSTTSRKLKVRWTKEAEQDMNAYHKIDVEQELVKVAAVQTNYEIDRQIMNAIDDIVISQLVGSFNWADDEVNGTTGNYLDRHRALAQRMYQYCTKVAMFNRLAPADWAVCSPQVAAALQMLPDWKAGEISHNKSTFYNAGSLGNGTVAIYCDPNRMNNDITLGYKAKDSTYGAGIVYSPYANWMSATIVNPDNFNNVRGTFSRYGITSTPRAEFNYARVTLENFAI